MFFLNIVSMVYGDVYYLEFSVDTLVKFTLNRS